jgi:riboflavin biosynthesis pyrimidine reductase
MTSMRALLPHPADDVDLHEHYARGWLERGGVRVDMISSMDGAGSYAGRSAGLQTPGDNRVFAALRDLADVVLVGSATARVEGYAPVRLDPAHRARRRQIGIADVLTTAVLTRRLDVDPGVELFSDAGPDAPTIVVTCAASALAARTALRGAVEVVVCGDDTVDLGAVRNALAERGLTRVLCEGGPTTFATLAAAGQMDELCLSLTPLLAGPAPWPVGQGARRLRLDGLLEEDGALFARLVTPRADE